MVGGLRIGSRVWGGRVVWGVGCWLEVVVKEANNENGHSYHDCHQQRRPVPWGARARRVGASKHLMTRTHGCLPYPCSPRPFHTIRHPVHLGCLELRRGDLHRVCPHPRPWLPRTSPLALGLARPPRRPAARHYAVVPPCLPHQRVPRSCRCHSGPPRPGDKSPGASLRPWPAVRT